MRTDFHESFCVLGLHSEMSTHTTHFKEGPFKRVQAIVTRNRGIVKLNIYIYIYLVQI